MSYFITTPIYYVNDVPHIGHAYTTIACDILSRFSKLKGDETYFLTGTDEHGQKVEKAAFSKKKGTQDFVDEMSKNFKDLVKKHKKLEAQIKKITKLRLNDRTTSSWVNLRALKKEKSYSIGVLW